MISDIDVHRAALALSEEIDRQVIEFFAKGGQIKEIPAGQRTEVLPGITRCRCGCEGDYTEHSMRAGESGRYSSEIVR